MMAIMLIAGVVVFCCTRMRTRETMQCVCVVRWIITNNRLTCQVGQTSALRTYVMYTHIDIDFFFCFRHCVCCRCACYEVLYAFGLSVGEWVSVTRLWCLPSTLSSLFAVCRPQPNESVRSGNGRTKRTHVGGAMLIYFRGNYLFTAGKQ